MVGLSADPTRPSHGVARALQRFGYRIIPVTPSAEVILGEPAVPDLDHLPEVLGPGEHVDIVDVFRRPEHVAGIVDECIRLRLPALWLQDGVIDERPLSGHARRHFHGDGPVPVPGSLHALA